MANTVAFQLPPYYNAFGVLSFGTLLNTADVNTTNILDNPLQIVVETEAKSWHDLLQKKVVATFQGQHTVSGELEFAVAEAGACLTLSLRIVIILCLVIPTMALFMAILLQVVAFNC